MNAPQRAHLLARFTRGHTRLETETKQHYGPGPAARRIAAAVGAALLLLYVSPVLVHAATPTPSPSAGPICSLPLINGECTAGSTIGGSLPSLPNPVADLGTTIANAVFGYLQTTTASAALWALQQVGHFINTNTEPNLTASWFESNYSVMLLIGITMMVPILIIACVRAAMTGNPGIAIKAGVVYVPACIIGSMAAIFGVDTMLKITNGLSSLVYGSTNQNFISFATNVGKVLSGNTVLAPVFVLIMSAVAILIFGFIIFLELLMREAAIYLVVLFVPLAMAAAVMPDIGLFIVGPKLARRGVDLLMTLILSKFIIVVVLSLIVSGLAASAASGGFVALMVGVVLLALAAYAPYKLFMMIPAMESVARVHTSSGGGAATTGIAVSSGAVYARVRRDNEARMGVGSTMMAGPAASGSGGGAASNVARQASSVMRGAMRQSPTLTAAKYVGMNEPAILQSTPPIPPTTGKSGTIIGKISKPPRSK